MHPTKSFGERVRLFLKIFLPILIYELAIFSASFIDTVMTGQYSQTDLAGVSMAANLWAPFLTLLTGILSALVPIIGQHLGSHHGGSIRATFYQFIYIALGLSVVLFLIVSCIGLPALDKLGIDDVVAQSGKRYLGYLMVGIIPILIFTVLRSFLDALGMTWLSMCVMVLIIPINAGLNYLLIYGKMGLPHLGGAGTGLGTSMTNWLVLVIMVLIILCHPKISVYKLYRVEALNRTILKEGLFLGIPIGLQGFAETAIFSVVGLLMAQYNSLIIAAQEAALNFSTVMYAFPLSIALSMPILVSYEVGAKRYEEARQYATIGRVVAMIVACFTLMFLYMLRGDLARLYGHEANFITQTSQFLTYVLFFQIADSFTAPIQGILRGYKDTRIPFLLGVSAYWLVSLPVGWGLSHSSLGPFGYWIGLIIGIFICGLLMQMRLTAVVRRVS